MWAPGVHRGRPDPSGQGQGEHPGCLVTPVGHPHGRLGHLLACPLAVSSAMPTVTDPRPEQAATAPTLLDRSALTIELPGVAARGRH